MRFSRKQAEQSIPTVPDDAAERLGALARSTDELRRLQADTENVNRVAKSVKGHVRRNHLIERLQLSYGMPGESRK